MFGVYPACIVPGKVPLLILHFAHADALLKKKVKVDALDKANMTPLHLAAQRGASAVIPALSAAGGEAALESLAPGKTPLMLAAGAGHMETVAALIKAGAKLGAQVGSGWPHVEMIGGAGPTL
jgi:ankyrin repeat protein